MENVNRRKGQMIIVGGFLVAIGIVALTLSLNTVIFTQDISTRDGGEYERTARGMTSLVENSTEKAIEGANERNLEMRREKGENGTVDDAVGMHEEYIDTIDKALTNQTLSKARFIEVSVDESEYVNASRVVQTEVNNYTNNDSEPDWNLTDDTGDGDVDEVFNLSFNVSDVDSSDFFEFRAVRDRDSGFAPPLDTTQGWVMRIKESKIITCEGEVYDAGTFCPLTTARKEITSWDNNGTIEVVNGSVNGVDRSGDLQNGWVDDGNTYFLQFDKGDNIEGTYDITFDPPSDVTTTDEVCGSQLSTSPCSGGADRPSLVGAVQEASAEYEYQDIDVSYNETLDKAYKEDTP